MTPHDSDSDAGAPDLFMVTRWAGSDGRLDCETECLLRAHLRPVFQQAESWADLAAALSARGFRLSLCDGRLTVTERSGAVPICTARYLGYRMADLVALFGRPALRLTQRDAADILH
jgi:hypothetical protein